MALRAREVEVPRLTGQSTDQARRSLAAVGLSLRVDENQRADPEVPLGRIAQQDPPAGVAARRQRTIRVWLSAGARASTVPAVVGQTERMAQAGLAEAGFPLESVTEFRSPDYAADTIVAQVPPPAAQGRAVSVLVNRGERARTFVMPDLIGFAGVGASDALRARGFRVTIVGEQPYPGLPPGTVVRQQPPGGFQVGPGDPISIEVSR